MYTECMIIYIHMKCDLRTYALIQSQLIFVPKDARAYLIAEVLFVQEFDYSIHGCRWLGMCISLFVFRMHGMCSKEIGSFMAQQLWTAAIDICCPGSVRILQSPTVVERTCQTDGSFNQNTTRSRSQNICTIHSTTLDRD